jgi:site-specific DNA-methyltransferase (adenine-specific)
MAIHKKARAPRNRTLTLTSEDQERLRQTLYAHKEKVDSHEKNLILCGDYRDYLLKICPSSIDLLFLDPPYNLNKTFNGNKFSKMNTKDYTEWLAKILGNLKPLLSPTASIYICGDWHTSHSIYEAATQHFIVRNRITWEREKGRGAKANWKNSSEDIWFCTNSDDYQFNVDSVKLRRRVVAPYRDDNGEPKDWDASDLGNLRDTHPSNLWTDITIPFWSMPENTDHPTQKSEKLLAKLILASSKPGDQVLDPFLGSGTTAIVADKLARKFYGIEVNEEYCLLALRRLELSKAEPSIQGYDDGVFWERNTLSIQTKRGRSTTKNQQPGLLKKKTPDAQVGW